MVFRDCVAATAFRDYSREDGKSPVGGTVALVQGDCAAAVKRELEIWSTTVAAVTTRARNCVVATVTSLVTSAMQYSEVRVVCVAGEHCSRRRCGTDECGGGGRGTVQRGNTGDDANAEEEGGRAGRQFRGEDGTEQRTKEASHRKQRG